jgi:hypothetical protein
MDPEHRTSLMDYDLIGAYKTVSKTGWAGCNKEGNTWSVEANTGQQL